MDFHLRSKICVLTLLIVSLILSGCSEKSDARQKAPDFALEDLSGNTVTLGQYRGNIVLLDFWATWCFPCLMSIPELVNLQKKYRDRGVVILGVSVDNPDGISNQDLLTFKERLKINYKILRANNKVLKDYFSSQRMGIPTMFIINRDGEIAAKHVGFEQGVAEKLLKKLL